MLSRRQFLIRTVQLGSSVAVPSLLIACQPAAPPAPAAPAAPGAAPTVQARRGGTLRVAYHEEFRTLDPHFSLQVAERYMMYAVYNTLVGMDEDFTPVPELAESWSNPDPRSYVFKLRQAVKFHDGSDFDAEAVKWNIDRLKDPATKSPRASDVNKIDSVEVIDKYTVKFNLTMPFAPLLAVMMDRPGFMVSPSAARKSGADYGRNPVGTGPFKFVQWTQDQGATVERNTSYWNAAEPYVDRVEFRLNPDPTVRVTMLKSGEVDLIDRFDTKDVPGLQADSNLKVLEQHGGAWQGLQWHVNEAPFDNKLVRQAVAWGVNRQALGKIQWSGYGDIPNGPVTIALGNPERVKPIGFDQAKARDLLAQAGKPNGFEATMTVRSRADDTRLGELVQAQLADLGIKLTLAAINANDWTVATQKRTINWTTTSWTQRGDPDGLLSILYASNGSANTTNFADPQVDDLLEKASSVYDPVQRKALYMQIQQIIVDSAPMVFLWRPSFFYATAKKVSGVQAMPDNILRTRTIRLAA
jgi:peptide/nickel transport system substrate-binding protein